MTSGEKIAYLKQYRVCLARERDLRDEIETLRSRAARTTACLTQAPGGGSNGNAPFVSSVEKIETVIQSLCESVEKSCLVRAEICKAITALNDPALCRVLYLRYIAGFTWEVIAVEMGYSYQWACELHGKALCKFKTLDSN